MATNSGHSGLTSSSGSHWLQVPSSQSTQITSPPCSTIPTRPVSPKLYRFRTRSPAAHNAMLRIYHETCLSCPVTPHCVCKTLYMAIWPWYVTHPNGVVEILDVKAYTRDFPDKEGDLCTCGGCGRTWDDSVGTSVTPVPSARCPFEYEHEDED